MRRYHSETTITKRNHRNHLKMYSRLGLSTCPRDQQVGRFRKKDAYDCGKSRCFICSHDQLPKRTPTQQEKKSELYLDEVKNGAES